MDASWSFGLRDGVSNYIGSCLSVSVVSVKERERILWMRCIKKA